MHEVHTKVEKRTVKKVAVALALALVTCGALPVDTHAETITGRMVDVADGDTVTVLNAEKVQQKIRLAGIDAPENAQAFGSRSKENLSALVFQKDVLVGGKSATVTAASWVR